MSFLTKTTYLTRTAAISASRLPTAYTAQQRHFSATPYAQKTVTDSVTEGLKKADRAVSDNIVLPAVDAVAAASETVQGAKKKVETGEAQAEVKGKAEELKGKAKGAAAQAEGEAKGAAEQVKHKL